MPSNLEILRPSQSWIGGLAKPKAPADQHRILGRQGKRECEGGRGWERNFAGQAHPNTNAHTGRSRCLDEDGRSGEVAGKQVDVQEPRGGRKRSGFRTLEQRITPAV